MRMATLPYLIKGKNITEKKVSVFALLCLAFVIQMITAWNCYNYGADEYFQIIDFASYKLGITPRSALSWEFAAQIRPSIQVYIFEYLYRFLAWIGQPDRFVAISILHIMVGIFGFFVCNYLVIKKFRKEPYLFYVLLLTNFLGIVPYIRASFSAEAMGGLMLMLSLLVLERALELKSSLLWFFLAGVTMGFAVFFRFQVGFAYVGVAAWLLIFYKHEWKKLMLVFIGLLVSIALNTLLDASFYGNLCCTPYNYFFENIIRGRAAAFGVEPWWYYLAI
ncbi:MAG TPA: hypothetical protein VGG71_06865, partial [Chitinophagaceae bacterium]